MYFAHKLKVFSFNLFLGKYIFCQEGETKGKELPNYMSSICELLTSYSNHELLSVCMFKINFYFIFVKVYLLKILIKKFTEDSIYT